MTIVFLLYAVTVALLLAGSALVFHELLLADPSRKAPRKQSPPVSAPRDDDAPPLRRAA